MTKTARKVFAIDGHRLTQVQCAVLLAMDKYKSRRGLVAREFLECVVRKLGYTKHQVKHATYTMRAMHPALIVKLVSEPSDTPYPEVNFALLPSGRRAVEMLRLTEPKDEE